MVVCELASALVVGLIAATVDTAAQLGAGVAYAVGGPLVALTNSRTVLLVSGAGVLATVALLAPTLRHLSQAPRP